MDYESTLLTKPECLVYRLPPRTTVRGYRAADWGLDKPAWTGRMRVTAKGKAVSIKVGTLTKPRNHGLDGVTVKPSTTPFLAGRQKFWSIIR